MTSMTFALSGSGFSWTAAAEQYDVTLAYRPPHTHTNTHTNTNTHTLIQQTSEHTPYVHTNIRCSFNTLTHILTKAHPIKPSVGTTNEALLPCCAVKCVSVVCVCVYVCV